MIPDCGKPACPILFPDGSLCTFYNNMIDKTDDIIFTDEYGNQKYTLQFDSNDAKNGYRALTYYRFMSKSSSEEEDDDKPIYYVLYVKEGSTGQPIYDCICPQVAQTNGTNGMVLVYWTNLKKSQTMNQGYDSSKIYKINNNKIQDETFDSVQKKVLMSASIRFEMLSVNDSELMLVPICYQINVLGTYPYAISDYAGGTGGGGSYRGMFKLGLDIEEVQEEGAEPKVYLKVTWPDCEQSFKEGLVGRYKNNFIVYPEKSIQLKSDINIYVDIYRGKIIVANPQLHQIGTYWVLLGNYNQTKKSISQLFFTQDGENLYTGYTGMFHLFLDVDVTLDDSGNITSQKKYLGMDWRNLSKNSSLPPDYEQDSFGTTITAYFLQQFVYFVPMQVSNEMLMFCFDINNKEIVVLKQGDNCSNQWLQIGFYSTKFNSHILQIINEDDFSGIDSFFYGYFSFQNFFLIYDRKTDAIKYSTQLVLPPQNPVIFMINNVQFVLQNQNVSLSGNAVTVFAQYKMRNYSEEIDPDLSDERVKELMSSIQTKDDQINTLQPQISEINNQIRDQEYQLSAVILNINSKIVGFNVNCNNQRAIYSSNLYSIKLQYNNDLSVQNTLNNQNLYRLKTNYQQLVAQEKETHLSNLSSLDKEAEDYKQKVALQNARYNTQLLQLKSTYNDQVATENERYSNALKLLENNYNQSKTNQYNRFKTELTSLQTSHKNELNELNTQLTTVQNDLVTLRNQTTTLYIQINSLETQKSNLMEELYGQVVVDKDQFTIICIPGYPDKYQTDQYFYIRLGVITKRIRRYQIDSLNVFTCNYIEINQVNVQNSYYVISNECGKTIP